MRWCYTRAMVKMRFCLSDSAWAASIDPKRMYTRKEFFAVYFSHYAVAIYVALAVVTGIWAILIRQSWWQFFIALALSALLYPIVEFCLHRFVLHGRFFYKSRVTAALWRRIHYDHHRDPNDFSVLIGAPSTTISAILLITLPIGYLSSGYSGMIATMFGGFIAALIYEFSHLAAHLQVSFKSRTMAYMRRHHALHHFHSELGNYGIVTNIVDRAIGTEYESVATMPASPTVNNLGYRGDEITKYPWVAEQENAEKTAR